MKKILLAALIFLPTLTLATPGAYISAGAGVNYVNSDLANTMTGFGGSVGTGYLWGDNTINYGLEINGTIYPDSTSTTAVPFLGNADVKIDGYNISLLGVLKYTSCSSGFVAFGKFGGAYVNQKETVTYTGSPSATETGTQLAPEAAAGIGYQFNPNWEMNLTANYVFTNGNNTDDNGNLLLGLTYHFV